MAVILDERDVQKREEDGGSCDHFSRQPLNVTDVYDRGNIEIFVGNHQ